MIWPIRSKLLGIASLKAEAGDTFCVLFSGQMPFVLGEQDSQYNMIGECYLHGIIDEDAVSKLETEAEEERSGG